MQIITLNTVNNTSYAECVAKQKIITIEQDAVNLIGLCGYHHTNNLLLYADNVDDRFFELKSTLAGNVLQKFMNYYMRVAMIMKDDLSDNKRFKEMALETNKGNYFRIFKDKQKAVDWLTSG